MWRRYDAPRRQGRAVIAAALARPGPGKARLDAREGRSRRRSPSNPIAGDIEHRFLQPERPEEVLALVLDRGPERTDELWTEKDTSKPLISGVVYGSEVRVRG